MLRNQLASSILVKKVMISVRNITLLLIPLNANGADIEVHTWQVSHIYREPPVFPQSKFWTEIAIIDSLMFSCSLLVWSCRAELKYSKILAIGGRGSELQLLKNHKSSEKLNLQYFWSFNLPYMSTPTADAKQASEPT